MYMKVYVIYVFVFQILLVKSTVFHIKAHGIFAALPVALMLSNTSSLPMIPPKI